MATLTCSKCGEIKEKSLFYKNAHNKSGYFGSCKVCVTKRTRDHRLKDVEGYRRNKRERRLKAKLEVYSFYGNKCACCGEIEQDFLTIDHVNGDGARHRKNSSEARTNDIYRLIIREGFPKDKYQLLCRNCNWSKGSGPDGICVHKR
jgi:hypothetical protein